MIVAHFMIVIRIHSPSIRTRQKIFYDLHVKKIPMKPTLLGDVNIFSDNVCDMETSKDRIIEDVDIGNVRRFSRCTTNIWMNTWGMFAMK